MKIFKYILPALFISLLIACAPEEKNLFEDSSANRMSEALRKTREVLTGAENGWLMEYYPASQQTYGGYNVLASFTDTDVTVSSEISDFDLASSSSYALKQSAGPVLTFDTYNEEFHIFSDPDSRVSGHGSNGVGMGGDFEFLILKAEADSVVLKGKKTGNRIVMTPFKENSWEDYMEEIQDKSDLMTFSNFEFHIAGQVIPVRGNIRRLSMTYEDEEGNEVTVNVPYIQTRTGYKLYSPLELLGVTIEEFIFQEEGELEFFTTPNDETARLVVVYPPLNEVFINGNWYFKFSAIGPFGQAYWDYTKTNGLDSDGVNEELYYAYMGYNSTGVYAFNFASYSPAAGGAYAGSLFFKVEAEGVDKIQLSFLGQGDGNGVWYYNNAAFAYIIYPLHGNGVKTFHITSDNDKNPTQIYLEDEDDPNNTFILDKALVVWPFDK